MEVIERMIREYGKDIYSFCIYLTGSRDLADDLYQQTFLTAIEKGDIDPDNNPRSYLLGIAVNLRNNQRRKLLFRRNREYLESDDVYDVISNISDGNENMGDELERKERNKEIRKGVALLPEKLRQVVIMYYTEDLPVAEIASILNISEGTVKSRLSNARKKLKERLIRYEAI
ncbi:MAG: RNA polymerase sigma factor [Clostridiales bacterium]|nr:RNA polymerase sigma factor [Clostridiales bacterium]